MKEPPQVDMSKPVVELFWC